MTSEGPHDAGHDPAQRAPEAVRGAASVPGRGPDQGDEAFPPPPPAFPPPTFPPSALPPPAASAPAGSAPPDSRHPGPAQPAPAPAFPPAAPPDAYAPPALPPAMPPATFPPATPQDSFGRTETPDRTAPPVFPPRRDDAGWDAPAASPLPTRVPFASDEPGASSSFPGFAAAAPADRPPADFPPDDPGPAGYPPVQERPAPAFPPPDREPSGELPRRGGADTGQPAGGEPGLHLGEPFRREPFTPRDEPFPPEPFGPRDEPSWARASHREPGEERRPADLPSLPRRTPADPSSFPPAEAGPPAEPPAPAVIYPPAPASPAPAFPGSDDRPPAGGDPYGAPAPGDHAFAANRGFAPDRSYEPDRPSYGDGPSDHGQRDHTHQPDHRHHRADEPAPYEQPAYDRAPYDQPAHGSRAEAPAAHARVEAPPEAPASFGAPVPQQRPPMEGPTADADGDDAPTGRPVSASAAVPAASRMTPADGPPIPQPTGAPRSRVYGSPAPGPEPEANGPRAVADHGRADGGHPPAGRDHEAASRAAAAFAPERPPFPPGDDRFARGDADRFAPDEPRRGPHDAPDRFPPDQSGRFAPDAPERFREEPSNGFRPDGRDAFPPGGPSAPATDEPRQGDAGGFPPADGPRDRSGSFRAAASVSVPGAVVPPGPDAADYGQPPGQFDRPGPGGPPAGVNGYALGGREGRGGAPAYGEPTGGMHPGAVQDRGAPPGGFPMGAPPGFPGDQHGAPQAPPAPQPRGDFPGHGPGGAPGPYPGGPGGPGATGTFGGQPATGGGQREWDAGEPGRFDQFRPEPAAEAEQEAVPQVRNGRVLLAVLAGAALLLVLPFLIVWLVTRPSDGGFEVGSCVKQDGTAAVSAGCGESGAFEIVQKVANEGDCPDPNQPAAVLPDGEGRERVLCLRPATG